MATIGASSSYLAPTDTVRLEIGIRNLEEHMRTYRYRQHSVNAMGSSQRAWCQRALQLADEVEFAAQRFFQEAQDPRLHNAWHVNTTARMENIVRSLGAQLRSMLEVSINTDIALSVPQTLLFPFYTPFGQGLMEETPDEVVDDLFANYGVIPMDEYFHLLDDIRAFDRDGYDSTYDTPVRE